MIFKKRGCKCHDDDDMNRQHMFVQSYQKVLNVNNERVLLNIIDTAGQEDYQVSKLLPYSTLT